MKAILCFAPLFLLACGGDDPISSVDGGGEYAPDGAIAESLQCDSLALCTSHEVKQFVAEPSTPTGGTISDGVYVLAWENELDPDPDQRTEGYYNSVEAIVVSGTHYVRAGFGVEGLGTIETSGTTLTFNMTENCSLGESGGETSYAIDFAYTALADRLVLYDTISRGDDEWTRERVFLRRAPDTICDTEANEPTAPGPSAQCMVNNCYCRVAVNGTIDYQTCE